MEYAFIFLIIFGVAILLAALRLYTASDPRKSIFFARVRKDISHKDALETAKKMSRILCIVGAVIIILCVLGLLLHDPGM